MTVPRSAIRAMQIWQVLIAAAHERKTLTYGELANIIGVGKTIATSKMLGPIMKYCKARRLPPLTCLVVQKISGLPGKGLVTVQDLPRQREEVYRTKWYQRPPVQVEDLEPYC